MPKLVYATRSVNSVQCVIRKDFSFLINSEECLNCACCYSKTRSAGSSIMMRAGYLNEEEKINKLLYKTPVIASRFFEPFFGRSTIKESLILARHYRKNDGQVIFRTFYPHPIFPEIFDFYKENKNDIQFQMKFVANEESFLSAYWKKKVFPSVKISLSNTLTKTKDLIANENECIAFFDPVIVGLNLADISVIIDKVVDLGVKKVVFKQLFATDYFVSILKTLLSPRYISMLSEGKDELKTYKNEVLLFYMQNIIEKCYKNNIDFSFCLNMELNKLFNVFDKYSNCCLFENAKGIYTPKINPMYRRNPQDSIIDLTSGYNKEIQNKVYG